MEKFGFDKIPVSKDLKGKLKKTLATSMAGLVLSAGGDWSQGEKIDKGKGDNEKKETTIKIENEETALEKKWGKKYEQARESFRGIQVEAEEGINKERKEKGDFSEGRKGNQNKERHVLEKESLARIKAEEIRENLRKHIEGDDYLKKLTEEFNGRRDLALMEQERRLKALNEVEVVFMSGKDIFLKIREDLLGNKKAELPPDWLCEILGEKEGLYQFFSSSGKGKVYLANKVNKGVYLHELQHAATRGKEGINKKVRDILTESYLPLGNPNLDRYLIDPAERLTRKQLADFELEKLGIKKYGEKFTKKHIPKIIECYERGLFSEEVSDFFETTDIAYWELIFNGIAQNEIKKDFDQEILT